MLRRAEGTQIYAIKFEPDLFELDMLDALSGLGNLEQIQLANCSVGDDDLKRIPQLLRLTGIGLSGTRVTDAGLEHLRKFPRLRTIECDNTQITGKGLASFFIK